MEWETRETCLRLGGARAEWVVEGALARVAAIAKEKGVEVATEVGADLPRIRADAAALARALGHLVENAVKFTPEGGHIRVTARLVPTESGGAGEQGSRYSLLPAPWPPCSPAVHRTRRPGHRHRHSTRGHPQDLRALLPGRLVLDPRARGDGSGSRHREAHPGCPRSTHCGGEPSGPGHHLFHSPPDRRLSPSNFIWKTDHRRQGICRS